MVRCRSGHEYSGPWHRLSQDRPRPVASASPFWSRLQPWLARIAELEGEARLSFKDGRRGWLVTTPLDLFSLRRRLGRYCPRINAIHASQGRFFIEPGSRYFRRALPTFEIRLADSFLTPQRVERLRRLKPFLRVKSLQPHLRSEPHLFHALALRLDGLSGSRHPHKMWKHVADDFDRLWRKAPLFAIGLTELQVNVLKTLAGENYSAAFSSR